MKDMDLHQNVVVTKPWGYEYLVFQNEDVALWYLHIDKGQSTSMHCHPKKTTGLILLQGEAEVSFLADKRQLKALNKVMIRRGLFHSTKALSEGGVDIFEIETPPDKHDLVRLSDGYGRENQPYEKTYQERTSEHLWIDKQLNYKPFAGCTLCTWPTLNNTIEQIPNDDIIVFLKGGLVRNIDGKDHLVTVPGDVGFAKIIKPVAKQLDGVQHGTYILTISK